MTEFDPINKRVIKSLAGKFNRIRTQKYQGFKVGDDYFPGILHSNGLKEVQSTHLKDQIKYLKLDEVDFVGKSVLDIGCNIGAFSLEARYRGASDIYGVDTSDNCIAEACILQAIENLNYNPFSIKYRKCDFMNLDGKYDITMFLAILHHCPNPFKSLQKLKQLTSGMCIMEIQTADLKLGSQEILEESLDINIKERYRGAKFGLGFYPTKDLLMDTLQQVGFTPTIVGKGKIDSRLIIHAFVQ